MKREMNAGDERLAAVLKAADPLRDDEVLSRPEAALMKQALLAEAEGEAGPGWISLAAGAALATLSLAAILVARVPGSPPSGSAGAIGSPGVALRGSEPGDAGQRDPQGIAPGARERYGAAIGDPSAGESRRVARTIHFTTRGGTRVVWTLNPDFEIHAGRRSGPDRS